MFLVISDDLPWCKRILEPVDKDVVVNDGKGTLFEDMTLISLGAHTIISVGSYGAWGATLGYGRILFPARKMTKEPYFLQIHLKNIKNPKVKGLKWDG